MKRALVVPLVLITILSVFLYLQWEVPEPEPEPQPDEYVEYTQLTNTALEELADGRAKVETSLDYYWDAHRQDLITASDWEHLALLAEDYFEEYEHTTYLLQQVQYEIEENILRGSSVDSATEALFSLAEALEEFGRATTQLLPLSDG